MNLCYNFEFQETVDKSFLKTTRDKFVSIGRRDKFYDRQWQDYAYVKWEY